MNHVLSLNGKWQGRGQDEKGHPLVLDAYVPGCVHTDLQQSGVIGDFSGATTRVAFNGLRTLILRFRAHLY